MSAAGHALELLGQTLTKVLPELGTKMPMAAFEPVGDALFYAAVERGLIRS